MDQQSISRINELARLAKTRALTSEESAERERLRKAYIAAFREQTRRTLDETRVNYEDGTHKSLREHLDAQKNRQGPKP